ncbi:MAG: toll/interleukin-1 receptor domain-containing protein [Bacteroidota bacterium]
MSEIRSNREGYIFISYKREEAEIAQKLMEALVKEGFEVWWDKDIQCGQQWASIIDEKLSGAGCVIILWSEKALNSPWVKHEASHALTRDVYAPARIELVDIISPYDQVQATDMYNWDGEVEHPGFRGLLNRATELLPERRTFVARQLDWLKKNWTTALSVLFALLALFILIWQTMTSTGQLTAMEGLLQQQQESAFEIKRLVHPFSEIDMMLSVDVEDPDSVLSDFAVLLESVFYDNPGFDPEIPQLQVIDELDSIGYRAIQGDSLGNPKVIRIDYLSSALTEAIDPILRLQNIQIVISKFPLEPSVFRPFAYAGNETWDITTNVYTLEREGSYSLEYNLVERRFEVTYSIFAPAENWTTSGEIRSLYDLPNCQLIVAVQGNDGTPLKLTPRMASLHANQREGWIDEWQAHESISGEIIWEFTFPKNVDDYFELGRSFDKLPDSTQVLE